MSDIDVQDAMNKIEEILGTLDNTEKSLIEAFGADIVAAAKILVEIEIMRNNIKQIRGQVMEFIV